MNVLQFLAGQVLEVSLSVGLVAGVFLLLRPLLAKRYRAKACYWVWLVLALRLVIPLNPSLPQAPAQITVPDPVLVYRAETTEEVPAATQPVSGAQVQATQPIQTVPEFQFQSPDREETPQSASYRPALTLVQLAAILWAAGAGVFLAVQLLRCALFRRRVRRWRQPWVEGPVMERFRALRAELGVRALTLEVCPAAPSPLVTGFFRPVLLLPSTDYTEEELDAIFRHELVHTKRRDLWYKLLLLVARAIHWFNPLVHLMARRAEQDLEISCDEAVVAGRDAAFQAGYGRAVLSAAEAGLNRSAPLTTHFKGGKAALKERLAAILGKAGQHKGVVLVCAVALLAAVVAGACAVNVAGSITGTWDGDGTLDVLGTQMPIEFARRMVFREDGTGYVQKDDGSVTEFAYTLTEDTITWTVGDTGYGLMFQLKGDVLTIRTGGADAVFTRGAEDAAPSPSPSPSPSPTAAPKGTAAFLSALTAEDFSRYGELSEEGKAEMEEFLSALQRAAENPVDPDTYERGYVGIWNMYISLNQSPDKSGGPTSLYLSAGLTENLVEIGLYGVNWSSLWVDDRELYQLVRTVHDHDYQIDQEALAAYREAVDAFLLENDIWANWEEYGWEGPLDVVYTHEVIGFELVDQSQALNAQVYDITHVFITDPPEQATKYLAGGDYLDSQFRYYSTGSDPVELLVAVDGKAVGFAPLSWLYEDGGLAQYGSQEELLAAVTGYAEPSPSPTSTASPTPLITPTPEPEYTVPPASSYTIAEMIDALTPEEILHLDYCRNPAVTAESVVAALKAAAGHTVKHYKMTLRGEDTDGIWGIDFNVSENVVGAGAYSLIFLTANLDENIVEVSTREQTIWLEDADLYWLVRTSWDTAEDVDWDAYNAYWESQGRDQYDWYEYAGLSYEPFTFRKVSEDAEAGTAVYAVELVFFTEPKLDIFPYMVGGAWVDSQVRLHTTVADGELNIQYAVFFPYRQRAPVLAA